MGFFNNNGFPNHEWKIFTECFPNIGCFRLNHVDSFAYLDDNVYRILHLKKNDEKLTIPKEELFSLIDSIERTPVKSQTDIYKLKYRGEQYWVKMKIINESDFLMGFIQDATHEMMTLAPTLSATDLDKVTNIYNRDAFIRCVREVIISAKDDAMGSLAVIHINGIEKVDSELNYTRTQRCIASVAETIKRFENENIFIGTKSYKDYFIFFNQMAKDKVVDILEQIGHAVKECSITDDFGEIIVTSEKQCFSINCGYCWYPEQAGSIDQMINYADFALFESMSGRAGKMQNFSFEDYEKEHNNYTEVQFLEDMINDNLFQYHFQPIVRGTDGEIIAYEALMRPKDSTPLKILELARRHGKLYDIERLTFTNVLEYIDMNAGQLGDKKIFINSIPDSMLTDEDFDDLFNKYRNLTGRIVIEITEQADITDEIINSLKNRCSKYGCQFAIDDYGAGYANTGTLLRCMPDYVKIDRALISEINSNTRKQHLFSGMVDFARLNNIKVLAEGVETYEELRVVIRRGADFIQGYYTARPNPQFIFNLSVSVAADVRSINQSKPEVNLLKNYNVQPGEIVSVVNLSFDKYTDVFIGEKNVILDGESDNTVNMNISVLDNTDSVVVLNNVNMRGIFKPCFIIGENSNVVIELRGTNVFNYEGICVPKSSSLKIVGSGDLYIDSFRNNGCGIGQGYDEPYGNIELASSGKIEISANGDNGICIGGGNNSSGSLIKISDGDISVTSSGIEAVGIGCYGRGANIAITNKCRSLVVNTSGNKTVGIGSMNENSDISLSADCRIKCNGKQAVGIGALENGVGSINISECDADICVKSQLGAGIGTINGDIPIGISDSYVHVYFEGDEIAGVGDCKGKGVITVDKASVDIESLAGDQSVEIGTRYGNVLSFDSNINGRILNYT